MKKEEKLEVLKNRQNQNFTDRKKNRVEKAKEEKSVKKETKKEISSKEISTIIYMFGTGQKFSVSKEKDKNGNRIVVGFVGRREPLVEILRPGILAAVNDAGTILTRSRNEKKKKEREDRSDQRKYLNDIKSVRMLKVKFNKFSQSGMQGEQKAPEKPERKGKEKKKA